MKSLSETRLRQLAEILDTADQKAAERNEPKYYQGNFTHACGAPACALAQWATHNPDRWEFIAGIPYLKDPPNFTAEYGAFIDFNITLAESLELFSHRGCGNAQSAQEAAAYIRRFCNRKLVQNQISVGNFVMERKL